MPLYEFHCHDCHQEVEILVRGHDEPVCPDCGGRHLNRLLSVVAAPGRGNSTDASEAPPRGPCGASCGCFPAG